MFDSAKTEYEHLYSGAFCVCHGFDAAIQQPVVLILERGAHFKGTNTEGFGTPGGYIDVATRTEQPRQGAVRELAEEIIHPDGSSVLGPVDPARLRLVDSGIDYSGGKIGGLHAGTVWHGFSCELTADEMLKLKAYAAKMDSDPLYADAVRAKSNQELGNVFLFPAKEMLEKIGRNEMKFAYAHEMAVVRKVAETLSPVAAPQHKPGQTI